MNTGIIEIDADTYHADPCVSPSLSNTIAQLILDRSPRHAWLAHPRLNPNYEPEEKSAFDLGSAAHALLLEGEDRMTVIPFDNYRTKEAQTLRDAARAAGKHPVKADEYADVMAMRDAALKAIAECADLSGLSLDDGKPEQTAVWQEDGIGIWLRSRLDWLADDRAVILDYKSTTDATPEVFTRQIARMGYHIQEAFYRRAVKAATGTDARFVFLAQETKPPYACSFHGIAPSLQQIAEEQVELAVQIWRDCVTRDRWPGYSNRIHYAEAANWQILAHEELVNAPGKEYDVAKLWSKP